MDIGGVSVVVMNNVPPHPANYLQRAGRAGRRRETRSVVFTLCKNNPHDQYVLNRPLWPFMTPMPSPRVSLNSEVLVQRHINAYLLAYFFRESVVIVDSILKLDVEWWIFPPADSPAKFFVKWLSELDEKSLIKLSHDLAFLVKRTILENRDVKTIVQNTCSIYQNFDKVSLMNYSTLNAQRSPTKLDDAVVTKNILVEQEQRLLDEYLLTALVKEGVLPAYGFPTNVIVFDANKVSTVKYPQNKANKFKALPKREANIALMEYAPNAQIVIDGLVYKSEGVILNWHLPASEDALAEVQSIRQLLLCQVCGVSQVTSYGLKVKSCENCGSPSRELQSLNYLEPTGLSVDYSRKPTTDVTAQRFIKPETTLISVNDKWQPIGDSDSGSGFYRASEKGHVFHHVAGLSGYGYAVCLECGRTVEMGEKGTLLEDFLSGHMRLRGEKIDRQLCSGTVQNNVIIQNLHLGYEHKTDVLELLLLKDERPIVDKTTAFTIAVAVRIAATRILGIELNSLGCDVKEIYNDQQRVYVIALYDVHAAGYSSSLKHRLTELLYFARQILDCPLDCQASCPSCLESFDIQFRTHELNRYKAIEFFYNKWDSYILMWGDDYFKPKTFKELRGLKVAIETELHLYDVQELRIFFNGNPSDWDLENQKLQLMLKKWSEIGHPVKILLRQETFKSCTGKLRSCFQKISLTTNISFWIAEGAVTRKKAFVCAQLVTARGSIFWVEKSENTSVPTNNWFEADGDVWRSPPVNEDVILIKAIT